MSFARSTLPPDRAWQPLPPAAFDDAAARHLLRRIGFSATAEERARALRDGPEATMERLLPSRPSAFPEPPTLRALREARPQQTLRLRQADERARRELVREAREQNRAALGDLAVKWLERAARPEEAAFDKWTFFLGDVWTVGAEKVKSAPLLFQHLERIRLGALGSYRALAKSLSRSPAMIVYLDLQQSRRNSPNENFARELFELFLLGEGNYSERDIREAARAFTGYRQRDGRFHELRSQRDAGEKTVFENTGPWEGDDVVDLAFREPSAATFLPGQLTRFYLSEEPLPPAYTRALGELWRRSDFDLAVLAKTFFRSRLFFDPAFRGRLIKSPLEYYLGLLRELDLEVPPFPRQVLTAFRLMGQPLFQPPNVRGWVGGKAWINSSTLSARRNVARAFFTPLNEAALNADEQVYLASARAEGRERFRIGEASLEPLAGLKPADLAEALIDRHLGETAGVSYRDNLVAFARGPLSGMEPVERARSAQLLVLNSPEYHLC